MHQCEIMVMSENKANLFEHQQCSYALVLGESFGASTTWIYPSMNIQYHMAMA